MAIIGHIRIDRASRDMVARPSTLRAIDDLPIDVELVDLSTTGCLLSGAIEIQPGMMMTIGIAGIGVRAARAVRRAGTDVGCEFLQILSPDDVAAAKASETLVDGIFPQSRRPDTTPALPDAPPRRSPLAEKIDRAFTYWDRVNGRQ